MIRILFAAANPVDTDPLRLGEELREIEIKLRGAEERSSFQLRSAWAVRADDLLQQMNEFRPNVLHLSGHGSSTGEIVLEDASGQAKPVPPAGLQALFANFGRWLQVVVLNACYSERQADALVDTTDVVIAMTEAVGDQASIVFASSLYRALAFGRSAQDAFDQGVIALQLEGINEHKTPILLSRRGVNPAILTLVGKGSAAAAMRRARDPSVPKRLQELLSSGSELVVVDDFTDGSADESRLTFFELNLRQSPTTFVVEANRDTLVEDVAWRIATKLLPKADTREYEWTLVRGDEALSESLSLAMAGVRSGDKLMLLGNHRRPQWAPSMGR